MKWCGSFDFFQVEKILCTREREINRSPPSRTREGGAAVGGGGCAWSLENIASRKRGRAPQHAML